MAVDVKNASYSCPSEIENYNKALGQLENENGSLSMSYKVTTDINLNYPDGAQTGTSIVGGAENNVNVLSPVPTDNLKRTSFDEKEASTNGDCSRLRSPAGGNSIATMSPIPKMTSTPISGAGAKVKTGQSLGESSSNLTGATSTFTTTPPPVVARPNLLSVRLKPSLENYGEPTGESLLSDDVTNSDVVNTSFTSQTSTHTTTHESQTDLDLYDQLHVPIIGYETMAERTRFTVFKIRVQKSVDECWHIFRRYSDFVRLNDILKQVFPNFRLALPPKKWFGDNYDRSFLDDRLLGLQAFLNNIISHRDVCNSKDVRDFLCIDDPPGAYDSLEESRAMCEVLEDQVYSLRHSVSSRDARINLLEEELSLCKAEIDNLHRTIRIDHSLINHRRHSPLSQHSESSNPEHEEVCSEVEADQDRQKESVNTDDPTSPDSILQSWNVISEKLKPQEKIHVKSTPAVISSDAVVVS